MAPSESLEGLHEFELCQGYYIIQICANGYFPKKTEIVNITKDETTNINMGLTPSSKIKIIILEEDGSMCQKGELLITSTKPKSRRRAKINNGIIEMDFNCEDITIIVDPKNMPKYKYQSITEELKYGEYKEITIRLENK